MKGKDLALVVVVAFIGGIVALTFSKLVIGSKKNRSETVEVVTPIVSDFDLPSTAFYNPESINPTKLIQIGNDPNPDPYHGQ